MSRKQAQPRRGAKVPKRIDDEGLTLRWSPDGADGSVTIDLTDWAAGDRIKRQTLVALGRLTAADGDWRRRGTVDPKLGQVRALVEWAGAHGIDTFSDVTLDVLTAFLDHHEARLTPRSYFGYRSTISVFLGCVAERSHTLRFWINERRGAAPDGQESRTRYYTRAEFAAIEQAAAATVSRARARVRDFQDEIRRIEQSGPTGRQDEVRMAMWRRQAVNPSTRAHWLPGPSCATGKRAIWSHFFTLTGDEILAAAVLLVCRNGWNLSPLLAMSTGGNRTGLGDQQAIFTTDADKARRRGQRHSRLVMVDSGLSSDGAAWRQVVEATQPGRDWLAANGVESADLLVYSTAGKECERVGGRDGSRTLLHPVRHGLPRGSQRAEPSWVPSGLRIDFPALRRTHQTLIRREPNQNTMSTHIEQYVMANPEVRAEIDADIAAGQAERLERAHETVTLQLSDPRDIEPELADGRQDTATASCRNIDRHPITGQPCTDSFFACLRCANAVATERHLPRLALLHRALEDRRSAVTERAWVRWQDDYAALTVFLFHTARLSDEAYRRHIASAAASDAQMVRDLLNGDLDATA